VFGYHLVNFIIHVANSFLVYGLTCLLFRTPMVAPIGARDVNGLSTRSARVALTAALLFAVHPIQTQAVTYIVQRYTNLVTLFYLVAVVCYLRWRLTDRVGYARIWWYVAAVGATVTLTATVTGNAPTGTVSFTEGGNPLPGCTVPVGLTGTGNSRTAACGDWS